MPNIQLVSQSDRCATPQAYLDAMGLVAAGVTIVATDGAAGRAGATVSAMTSVSVETQANHLLVCLNAAGGTCAAVLENGAFSVNVLNAGHRWLADRFAGRDRISGADKFAAGRWIDGPAGQPMVEDALASFECRLADRMRVGTHRVLVGRVVHIHADRSRSPLVYANRAYGQVTRLAA